MDRALSVGMPRCARRPTRAPAWRRGSTWTGLAFDLDKQPSRVRDRYPESTGHSE